MPRAAVIGVIPPRRIAQHPATRAAQRAATSRRLPAGQTDFTPELARGLAAHHGDVLGRLANREESAVRPLVEMEALRQTVDLLCADPDRVRSEEVQFLWRAASLQIWLESRQDREEIAA